MAEQKQLSINIAPDKQQGVFANLALIAHTPTEFVLDFAQLMPGVPQANVVSRVVVTPDQAKKAEVRCHQSRRRTATRWYIAFDLHRRRSIKEFTK